MTARIPSSRIFRDDLKFCEATHLTFKSRFMLYDGTDSHYLIICQVAEKSKGDRQKKYRPNFNILGLIASQKPGFLRQSIAVSNRRSKNPVSLTSIKNYL